jgi:hypothetical protein
MLFWSSTNFSFFKVQKPVVLKESGYLHVYSFDQVSILTKRIAHDLEVAPSDQGYRYT